MRRNLLFVFFGIALCFCAMTSAAQAQATRTWVSGVGDDVNPCSRTAPCKTFAGAISKTAAGGEIDALDPGGYGALTITKAITVDGGGGLVTSVLAANINAFIVNAGANDRVTLRNLSLNGVSQSTTPGLSGIVFNSGLALNVEHLVIQNFATFGINFQPTVRAFLHVQDTTIENIGTDGVIISTAASGGGLNRAEIRNSTVFNSGSNGVHVINNSRVELYACSISRNGLSSGDGVLVNGSSFVGVDDCLVANNGANGIHAQPSGVVRLSNSSVTDNGAIGTFVDGGQIFTGQNNRVQHNTGGNGSFSGGIPLS